MHASQRLALAAFCLAASPLAFANARLVASSPAQGQALDAPPIEIRLTFNERVNPRSCRIKLVSAERKYLDADRARADKSDPNSVVANVPVLRHGAWRAHWTATGADGRRMHGDISFTVK